MFIIGAVGPLIILAVANWRYQFHFHKGDRYLIDQDEDDRVEGNASIFNKIRRNTDRSSKGNFQNTMLTGNYEEQVANLDQGVDI